ncbi:MAG: outer membrane beta-barrel protein [Prevotella sp.]|jgi:hypothetical protein|nr:outer membrane beta-barrel protein [Prevotella sp.]MCI2080043.1 outer membrane beta-barrel protein [Prevotella sp.]MCI2101844.1 outer membrane beta-barrel protein [Prevotella sp.]
MKKIFLFALALFFAWAACAQRVNHEFRNTPMPQALQYFNGLGHRYTINFIYDDLEDFKVTASVRNLSIPDAIRQLIGFYPIRMTMPTDSIISVECYQKASFRFKGRVIDETGQSVVYANISLLSPTDSTLIGRGVTNLSGYFAIPCDTRKVIVRITYIGYQTVQRVYTTPDMGVIRMHPDAHQLRQVTVTSMRPTITFKGDRTIVDIRHSILGIGNSAESLLDQLPGVWHSGSSLSINGIPGVQVMINDRQVQLSGERLMNYLKTIRSEDIEKIEIIANPPAEFAAEGTGGVLRILTRQREVGVELTAGGDLDFPSYLGAEPYVQYSYNKGKFGFDVTGSATVGRGCLLVDEYSDNHKDKVDYTTYTKDKMNDLNGDLSTNLYYDFTEHDKLSANFRYYHYGKDEHQVGDTRIGGDNAQQIRQTDNHQIVKQAMNLLSTSINFRHDFGAAHQHSLLLLGDVTKSFYHGDSHFKYDNFDEAMEPVSDERVKHREHLPFFIVSSEARLTWQLTPKAQLMAGTKYSYSSKGNDFRSFSLNDGQWQENEGYGYDLTYAENLQATYLKYSLDLKHWSLTAGLRGEYDASNAKGYSLSYHHYDLFPSLFASWKPSGKNTLSLSLTRRTQRVSYMRLMPSRYFSSRYVIMEGNPALRPNYSYNLQFSWMLLGKYNLSLTHAWSNNGIESYNATETIGGNAYIRQSYVDGVKNRFTNLNLFLPVTIAKWWSVTNQVRLSYNRYITLERTTNDLNWSAYTQHTVMLPAALRFMLTYRYYSRQKTAYGKSDGTHKLSFSLMRQFLDKRLTTKLSVSNLLWAQKPWTRVNTGDVLNEFSMYGRHLPSCTLSFYYQVSWGKHFSHRQVESSNREEKSRAM